METNASRGRDPRVACDCVFPPRWNASAFLFVAFCAEYLFFYFRKTHDGRVKLSSSTVRIRPVEKRVLWSLWLVPSSKLQTFRI